MGRWAVGEEDTYRCCRDSPLPNTHLNGIGLLVAIKCMLALLMS